MPTSDIQIILDLSNPDLDEETLEQLTQRLRKELLDSDEISNIERVLDPNPPEGNKALGAVLVGLLAAEVNPKNIKSLFGFLGERLGDKAIGYSVPSTEEGLQLMEEVIRCKMEGILQAGSRFEAFSHQCPWKCLT